MMMKTLCAIIPLLASALLANAQSFNEILAKVTLNNTTLRAARSQAEARKEQGKVGLTLADPEIEVGYLFGSPRSEVNNRKDLSVTQRFDWAVLSGDKRRAAEAEATLMDRDIDEETRQLRETAALLLTEITYYNKTLAELHRRKATEERLLATYQTKMEKGDGTILEVNKAKMALAQVSGQITRTEVERDDRLARLRGLANDESIFFNDTLYAMSPSTLPDSYEKWAETHLSNTPIARIEEQKVAVSKAQAELAKAETKPSFSVGYKSELVKGSNYRGFAAGVTVPLWANRNKLNAARKAQQAAEEQRAATETEQRNKYRQLFLLAKARQKVAEEYKSALESIDNRAVLDKALSAGQTPLAEYLLERKYYYESYDLWLEAEKEAALATTALEASSIR